MATFKYYVRYKNGPSISNIAWTTATSTYPFSASVVSGVTPIPQNTWVEVYDSGVDESSFTQSLFNIQANFQADPTVDSETNLCNSNLLISASLHSTISLDLTQTSSLTLSGSFTGSFIAPQWIYVGSNSSSVYESKVTYISASFNPRNKTQQFDSFLQPNIIYNYSIGSPDPTFAPETILWSQIAGPAPMWFMSSTTQSVTLAASASISGSYSVIAQQNTTNPQILTISQSLPNSIFDWEVSSQPSNSIVYINSSSNQGNGAYQNVNISASVAGNYIFKVTEISSYNFYPTASIISSSGASVTLDYSHFSQSGEYTYALQAYNLCNSYVTNYVQVNVFGAPPVISSSTMTIQTPATFSYYITASNNPIIYSAGSLPPGLTLNSTTGLISGILSSTGSYISELTASNSFGTGYGNLNLTLNNSDLTSSVFSPCGTPQTWPTAISGVPYFNAGTLTGMSKISGSTTLVSVGGTELDSQGSSDFTTYRLPVTVGGDFTISMEVNHNNDGGTISCGFLLMTANDNQAGYVYYRSGEAGEHNYILGRICDYAANPTGAGGSGVDEADVVGANLTPSTWNTFVITRVSGVLSVSVNGNEQTLYDFGNVNANVVLGFNGTSLVQFRNISITSP